MNKHRNRIIPKKMNIKKGDNVVVLSGKDKGKIGEVLKSYPKMGMVVVDGVNVKVKHVKPSNEGKGGIYNVPRPVSISKVMFYSKEHGIASRLGKKHLEDGTKVRYMKKNEETV